MRFISWNVNGLRACVKKGFEESFRALDADFFCLQETKLQAGQIDLSLPGYTDYWNYAEKKGYSGTAVFARTEPLEVTAGMGISEHDTEGRVLTLEYADFYLVTVYTPNSQDGLRRLDYRMAWEDAFREHLCSLARHKGVVVCGDMNVAHEEIDLKNPDTNHFNAGFSDQERAKMTAPRRGGRVFLVELSRQRPGEERGLAHRLFPGLRRPARKHSRGVHLPGDRRQRPLPRGA